MRTLWSIGTGIAKKRDAKYYIILITSEAGFGSQDSKKHMQV